MEEITGHIERITFHNPENAFTVAKLKIPKIDQPITLVGQMVDLQPGESLICLGEWKFEPKHGRQFQVSSYKKKAPATLLGIQKYLSSKLIKGIGPKFAEKIVNKFGLETLNIIEHEPEKLRLIDGLGEKKLDAIIDGIKTHKVIEEVMVFLQSHQITPSYAHKIYKRYGPSCIALLQQNPYQLARDIMGIGFKIADKIAMSLKILPNSPARIGAGIEFMLYELSQNGNTCYPKNELITQVGELLKVDLTLIEPILLELNAQKRVVIDLVLNEPFVWLKPLHICEVGIVKEIYRLLDFPCALRAVDTQKALDWVQEIVKIKFAGAQKEAIMAALTHKLLIITGGPGTGKSTITKAILRITEKLTNRIVLAAPTGKAAKRMTEITYRHASTIHSLLEYDFKVQKFKRNHENPIEADLLIIDEASMIDTYLMIQLLKAVPSSCRLIFIGDVDQLPSVGPGNVLRDLIASKQITTQTLEFIFRQQKGSKISFSAHAINKGFFPKLEREEQDDFIFIEAKEPEDVLKSITEWTTKILPQKHHFNPIVDIQVLAPMRKGLIGVENLNHCLQSVLNPTTSYLSQFGKRFAVHDKVIQIKNNYQKEVFNGDVGFVSAISLSDQQVTVLFDSKEVTYEFSELDEIHLAYCVSIHKFQGSEAPCIVMPIHTQHFKLLCRNLLYTGVTRGKKMVVLIGTKKALAIAIKNNEIEKRYTALQVMLCATKQPISSSEGK